MSSCDAQTLVALTPALNAVPIGLVPYAQLAVLCKILQSVDPMTDCSAATLVDNAKCLSTCVPPGLVQFAVLYLLCQMQSSGAVGSDFLLVYDNQAALPAAPSDPTKVWFASFRDGSAGKVWDPNAMPIPKWI